MDGISADCIVGNALSLAYGRASGHNLEVLQNISFTVRRGTIASIIGPSGCGKTTLLNCIIGFLKPQRGTLTIDGKSPAQARGERHFGLVPQEASLFEWKTVFDNILLPFDVFGHSKKRAEIRGKVQHLIELVGLGGFETAYPRMLSGGMKQRASLARALSFNPAVLLMDEPFGALDAQTREEMNLELLRIWSETKNTVVLITHDVSEAVLLSDRVFVMGARPAGIKAVLDIDLPRPRPVDVLDSQELHRYTRDIRRLLVR